MRVQLPSGGYATVSADVKPETLAALDEMLRAAAKQFAKKSKRGSAERGPAVKRNSSAGPRFRKAGGK
jgi:hypothetical protein